MRLKSLLAGIEVLRKYLVASIVRTLLKIKLPKIIISAPRTGELMSYQAVQEYLRKLYDRYRESSKKEKGRLLLDAEHFTELSRKHLIRVLNGPKEEIVSKKASGRPAIYDEEILLPHIRTLWIAMERISGKRMKAGLQDWLPHYEAAEFDKHARRQLEQISAATLERSLRKLRGEIRANKGLVTTKSPSRFMKNKVPLSTLDKKIDRPGFLQADTVAHCGTTTEGTYANSLTLTDINSTWTENRAVFTKKARVIRDQLVDIQKLLPFRMISLNVDNGSEFLNTPVLEFVNVKFKGEVVHYTRSRAYKKNDNCYVEQKNFTHVRELFGYERFESPELVEIMNDIYKTCWNPMLNFFIPTFKIKEKVRVGSKIIKKYDTPRTPYQRLLESEFIANEDKQSLREQKRKLNPFTLSTNLEKKLGFFFQELRKSKQGKVA